MRAYTILFYSTILVAFQMALTGMGECSPQNKYNNPMFHTETFNFMGYYMLKTDPDNPQLIKYMDAMGIDAKTQQHIRTSRAVLLIITRPRDNQWEVEHITNTSEWKMGFEFDRESEVKCLDGQTRKNMFTIDLASRVVHRVINADGFESTQDFTFGGNREAGLNVTLKAKDVTATLQFCRWSVAGQPTRDVIPLIFFHYWPKQPWSVNGLDRKTWKTAAGMDFC